jgi:hypothetical protein
VKGFIFQFDDMRREIDDFFKLAKDFLDPSAEACLKVLYDQLDVIRHKSPLANNPPNVVNKRYSWVISDHNPLLTRCSQGYEKGSKKGGPSICARITSKWEITPEPRRSNLERSKKFYLTGNASVRVEWRDTKANQSLGSWRMEIADEAAPGCCFHAQILGEEADPPFPHAVAIPRLPCIASTPMAVLEFVLGELFQDKWEDHSKNPSVHMESWRATQRHRLLSVLNWQADLVRDSAVPPWTSLKTQRPQRDVFIREIV